MEGGGGLAWVPVTSFGFQLKPEIHVAQGKARVAQTCRMHA